MKRPIYMDYNSTTPIDPRVLEAMIPFLGEKFGNPSSSSHFYGWEANESVKLARENVANLIAAQQEEIIFTSGATESNNLALKGIADIFFKKPRHIITSKIEHKSILDVCGFLQNNDCKVTYLNVDEYGFVNLEELEKTISEDTILLSVIFGNNEIGTIQQIEKIGRICKNKKIIFHTDATQTVGKIPVDVNKMNIDLMSFNAHKIYGPKGIGALYIRKKNPRVRLFPQILGGGQEKGLRSGTLNVPGIVGFGKACELCNNELDENYELLTSFRDKIINELLEKIPLSFLNGHRYNRLPNNINISFEYVNNSELITELKDIAISTGSACTSETLETSYVLKAIGRDDNFARSSIRIGIGKFNTIDEINYVINKIIDTVSKIRENSPLWEDS